MNENSRLKTDLLALGLLAVTVFSGLALASYDPADPPASVVYPAREITLNTCGAVGALVAHSLLNTFGMGAWFVLLSAALVDISLFARRQPADPTLRTFGWFLMVVAVCIACRLVGPGWGRVPMIGSGGYVGVFGLELLEQQFSFTGTLLIVLTLFSTGSLLAADRFMYTLLRFVFAFPLKVIRPLTSTTAKAARLLSEPFRRRATVTPETGAVAVVQTEVEAESSFEESEPEPEEPAEEQPVAIVSPPATTISPYSEIDETEAEDVSAPIPLAKDEDEEAAPLPTPRQPIRINKPMTAQPRPAATYPVRRNTPAAERPEYRLPEPDLLEVAEEFPYELLAERARIVAATLEKTFQTFGLNVRVVEIDTGPVITQYELELEAGLRLNKVTALADDLAIALRVPSVRVVAPIPGKNTVGVEVPNDKQVMVRLRELIEASGDVTGKKRIPIFLGKDVSGRPLVVDLAKMPHLLIAGRTGTGKSVCLNTLILSILMTRTPDEVKMLMIDPKMVELSPYKRVPHLMNPVITDMKKAEAVLAWAVDKMEERYDILARCGVRHLDSFNELGKEEILRRMGIEEETDEANQIPERMPYIVIIADEMADMMMTSGKDVEGHIIRLAQKSRAVGIHLVLATQKPTVDVITGLIKSNLPARISFQVASRVDSRVVLDEMGAERLLGNGDMLYLVPGTSKITRAQGTFVSDDEVNTIIDFFSEYEPEYCQELAQVGSKAAGKSGIEAIRARDELYEQAIEVVVNEGRGSVSLLQRCLGIGYGRAARLVDYMAEDGIVGDYNGSQAREVLYTPEQWAEIVAGGIPATADA